MLKEFITRFSGVPQEGEQTSRRVAPRRAQDQCVSVIAGKTFPVENWSMGGVLVYGDGRLFPMESEIDVILKFRLRNEVVEVPHKAKVVRKTYHNIALQFVPLTQGIRKSFQAVVDDYVSGQFADSQLV
ncbi:MAG: PilZ domain-containing protein [Alphaproteobacteria bacterium]